MLIIDNFLHTPYWIYIRYMNHLTDQEILNELGITNISPAVSEYGEENPLHVYITRNGDWVQVMDNFFYTLWYSETVKSKVAELGKNWDIFTCSRGDADYFFEFSCYKGGHKIREFRVDYPDSRTPEISINQGGPLPGEPEVLVTGEDPEPVLRAITEALGITVFHTYSNVKCYLISDEMNTWYQALSLYEE